MKRLRWLLPLATVVVALLTARLGWWQLDRAAQKLALQEAQQAQQGLTPLADDDLPRDPTAAVPLHRAVRLHGRWSAAHTVYLENRQMQGRPGFFVLTPLLLHDGRAIVVQRGWLPRDANDRTRVAEVPTPAGLVKLEGRIAPPPSRLYDFAGAASGPIRQNLDLGEFARETGLALLPFTVLQEDDRGLTADGLQRGWPQPAANVHKHYGYAFQWFALSALVIGLYAWFQFVHPRRSRPPRS
ncbi:MAG TPA: SURF1 family protein [Rubrivivax sp.]|nr:SURF1 family protein [Rubrivivax sp.]